MDENPPPTDSDMQVEESHDTENAVVEAMEVEQTAEEVDLRPIAILIDELSQEDMQVRIMALKQVTRIAEALGDERTRTELIPYLSDMLDDDDEVLRIICEVLIQLKDFVGGNDHFHVLIPAYETLCVVEENSIRNLAIEKLAVITTQIPDANVINHVPQLFNRLYSSGWHTARTAAAGLAHHLYPRLVSTPHGQELQDHFLQLALDDMPQVRRAVAENISRFAQKMAPQLAEQSILPVLLKLTEDDQDSVRVRALQALIEIVNLIKDANNQKRIRSQITTLCKDPSWRVRFLAASKFGDICKQLEVDNTLLELYLKLLKDTEAEVRAVASTQFPDISQYISEEIMGSKFLTTFQELSKDTNKYTRAQVAEVLVPVGTRFSQDFIITNILPLVLLLLKDSEPEPRLKCLSNLDLSVINAADIEAAIWPCLKDLAEDGSWRIRKQVLDLLPNMSNRLGPEAIEKINELILTLMQDQVQVVRENAAQTILRICEKTPAAAVQILTLIRGRFGDANYLRRQTLLEAIRNMFDSLPPKDCLETLLGFCDDPVPNVRFKLCNILLNLLESGKISTDHSSMISEKLSKMTTDEDPDVAYFSKKTLLVLNESNEGS